MFRPDDRHVAGRTSPDCHAASLPPPGAQECTMAAARERASRAHRVTCQTGSTIQLPPTSARVTTFAPTSTLPTRVGRPNTPGVADCMAGRDPADGPLTRAAAAANCSSSSLSDPLGASSSSHASSRKSPSPAPGYQAALDAAEFAQQLLAEELAAVEAAWAEEHGQCQNTQPRLLLAQTRPNSPGVKVAPPPLHARTRVVVVASRSPSRACPCTRALPSRLVLRPLSLSRAPALASARSFSHRATIAKR